MSKSSVVIQTPGDNFAGTINHRHHTSGRRPRRDGRVEHRRVHPHRHHISDHAVSDDRRPKHDGKSPGAIGLNAADRWPVDAGGGGRRRPGHRHRPARKRSAKVEAFDAGRRVSQTDGFPYPAGRRQRAGETIGFSDVGSRQTGRRRQHRHQRHLRDGARLGDGRDFMSPRRAEAFDVAARLIREEIELKTDENQDGQQDCCPDTDGLLPGSEHARRLRLSAATGLA